MRFKRKGKLALIIFVVFSCITLVASAAGEPGSNADPLVTKSYVDQKISELSKQISSSGSSGSSSVDSKTIEQLQADVGDLTAFVVSTLQEVETLKNRVNALESGFVVVEAKAGQTILPAGGSEVLLRSGSATAVKGTYGVLADATAGKDLNDGDNIPVQHLLISSRSDGRGLKIKTNAFMLIRGAYTVK
jgi:hypothetical protein